MKIFLSYCLIIVLIYSCKNERTNTIKHTEFYDSAQTKLKRSGYLFNGLETGEWSFFKENGDLACKGVYHSGLMEGVWQYYYEYNIDSIVVWNKWSYVFSGELSFSLPSNFKNLKELSNFKSFTAIDTIGNHVFSINIFNTDLVLNNLKEYSKLNLDEIVLEGYMIDSIQYIEVSSTDGVFLIDKLFIWHPGRDENIVSCNIYIESSNKIFIFNYTCSFPDSVAGFFYLGEIFHHSFYKGKRIANPFLDVETQLSSAVTPHLSVE